MSINLKDISICEVYETKDDLEAAKMIQSGNWTIIDGLIQGKEVKWVLARLNQSIISPNHEVDGSGSGYFGSPSTHPST